VALLLCHGIVAYALGNYEHFSFAEFDCPGLHLNAEASFKDEE
jgi:hypothetical protein